MENASKALLMAAGVLMGVLILSLAIYLFANFRASADENYELMRQEEIAQFNSNYLSYDGRENLNIYDVINIINMAKENNKKSNGDSSLQVKVYLLPNRTQDLTIYDNNSLKLQLENFSGTISNSNVGDYSPGKAELAVYKCKVTISTKTGRVSAIGFTKLP